MKSLIFFTFFISLKSFSYVNLSQDDAELGYELCSEKLGSVGENYLYELEHLMNNSVIESRNYRKAGWENSVKKWDTGLYPFFVRAPYWYLCAFNLNSGEALVFLHD